MKIFKYIIVILVINYSIALSQKQSDNSDSVWSIVIPQGKAYNIDMKQSIVNKYKDSVIKELISNIGSYDLIIDTIYFDGKDAKSFSIISGLVKFNVKPGNSRDIEIRFSPSKVGIHYAKINFVTRIGNLTYDIIGEGVEPKLEVMSRLIDFGKVVLGDHKDTIQALTIKCISQEPITILSTKHNLPNDKDFSTLSGGGNFTLNPGETHTMDLRYLPSSLGRTSGTLEFHFAGVGSPAIVQLFGHSIGTQIYMEDDSAYVGENKLLKLKISNDGNLYLGSEVSHYEAKISYNATLLSAVDNNLSKKLESTSEIINIKGQWDKSSNVLAEFEVKVGLGNSIFTSLNIDEFYWTDFNGDKLDIENEKKSGNFKILGLCDEGGIRLINPNTSVSLLNIAPNPSDGNVCITLSLIESGFSTINVLNSLGQVIYEKSFTEFTGIENIYLSSELLASGHYFIILKTPTITKTQKFIIYK